MTKTVATLLKNKRLELDLSVSDVALKSGLSRNAITKSEDGISSPSLDTFLKILFALNFDFRTLFDEVESTHGKFQNILEDSKITPVEPLDEELGEAVTKLKNKSVSNDHLRTALIELSKLHVK